MKKQWQPPKHWQDLEEMSHHLLRREHGAAQSYLYGRRGQAQFGVDIALHKPGASHWTGVQCKLKTEILGSELSEQELLSAYKQSCLFSGGLEELFVVTTCERDRQVQDRARVISESWQARHPITVLFWDDVEDLLEKHSQIASCYYPEAFAPENSLNETLGGDLNIALTSRDYSRRLALFFGHENFKATTGVHQPAVMTIVSEIVDNLFAAGKGGAQRVRVALSGRFLTITDDGVSFDSFAAPLPEGDGGGLKALRGAISASGNQLIGRYVAKDADVVYNATTLEIVRTLSGEALPCSAAGPVEYLLNRDDASRFVRNLHISEECESFTLRLYSTNTYANKSAGSQLIRDLRMRLNGRQLIIKIGHDCARFLPYLEYDARSYDDVSVEYV